MPAMAQEELPEEEIRTLYVSELPEDVKEREIYHLFRACPGYEDCQLNYTLHGHQIVAFVIFSDQASALAAKESLHKYKFDPSTSTVLNVELARVNSRVKRPHADDGGLITMERNPRMPFGVPGVLNEPGFGNAVHMPEMLHHNDLNGYISSQSGGVMGPLLPVQDGISKRAMAQSVLQTAPAGSNLPCQTLFLANLGPTCTVAELTHLLGCFPGFLKVKMQTRRGLPVAFVDFQDELCSTVALTQLQNLMLPSSDRGGIRVEYAKSKMGLPKRGRRQ